MEHLTSFTSNPTTTTDIYTLSLHDALPICPGRKAVLRLAVSQLLCRSRLNQVVDSGRAAAQRRIGNLDRSEEHTSELQSRGHLVCRLLLEKKKTNISPTCQSTLCSTCITCV